jgi:signal transduction histidine kinase
LELETANRVKSEFLSVMSHELRTPLSVVMGYAGMLKEGMLGPLNQPQEDAVQKMLARAGDQLSMINDIMQTTQLETHAVVPERRQADLCDLLKPLKTEYAEALKGTGVELVWRCPSEPLPVVTDVTKLKQILHNLINNAVKFTEKGCIAVSARVSGTLNKKIEVRVADTGIGISQEKQQLIFEKFRQADSSETRLYGGVGLGLYIAKQLTELLGGRIEVESEVGKGAAFTVTLPIDNGLALPAPRPVLNQGPGIDAQRGAA